VNVGSKDPMASFFLLVTRGPRVSLCFSVLLRPGSDSLSYGGCGERGCSTSPPFPSAGGRPRTQLPVQFIWTWRTPAAANVCLGTPPLREPFSFFFRSVRTAVCRRFGRWPLDAYRTAPAVSFFFLFFSPSRQGKETLRTVKTPQIVSDSTSLPDPRKRACLRPTALGRALARLTLPGYNSPVSGLLLTVPWRLSDPDSPKFAPFASVYRPFFFPGSPPLPRHGDLFPLPFPGHVASRDPCE